MIREIIEQIELEKAAEAALYEDEIEKLAEEHLEKVAIFGPLSAAISGAHAAGPEDRGRGALYGLGGGAALGIPLGVAGYMAGKSGGRFGTASRVLGTLGSVGGGILGGHLAGSAAKGHTARGRELLAKEIVRQQQEKTSSVEKLAQAYIDQLALELANEWLEKDAGALREAAKGGLRWLRGSRGAMAGGVEAAGREGATAATSGIPNPALFGKMRMGAPAATGGARAATERIPHVLMG